MALYEPLKAFHESPYQRQILRFAKKPKNYFYFKNLLSFVGIGEFSRANLHSVSLKSLVDELEAYLVQLW